MKIDKFLINYFLKYKLWIFLLFLLSFFSMIVSIAMTYEIGSYIDLIVYSIDMELVIKFSLILFVLGITNIIMGFFYNYFISKVQAEMVFDINFYVLAHLKRLKLNFFVDKDPSYLNQRINADTNTIINFTTNLIVRVLTIFICFFVLIGILLKLNKTITFAILISIPIYIFLYRVFKKTLHSKILNFKEEQSKLFSFMNKHLQSIEYIKLNSLNENMEKETVEIRPKFFYAVTEYLKYSILFSSIGSIIENLFNVFLFLYAGIEIINSRMSVGEFVIIKSYFSMVLSIVNEFYGILNKYPDALVSYNRIMDLLNVEEEKNGVIKLQNISSIYIEIDRMIFDDKKVFSDIKYDVKKGKIYIIEGENGAGKSTIIKCILGLYNDEYKGEILYNDVNVEDLDMYDSRRNLISVVDQGIDFLYESARGNLESKYGSIENEKIEYYLNKFSLNNIDIDNEDINKFSGGERQKIAIIKSLIENPELLIMDEPTSALDNESVNVLIEEIVKGKNEKITLIISHDKRFTGIADEIIYLK